MTPAMATRHSNRLLAWLVAPQGWYFFPLLLLEGLSLHIAGRQVLTSRNISGGPLISVLMGGLNHQVEHHLFPSIARPHLRLITPLVAAHCAAEGVPYTSTNLWTAYRHVIGYLNTVGLKGRDPFLCPLVAQRRAL